MKKNLLPAIICVLLGIAITLLARKCVFKPFSEPSSVKVDTLIVSEFKEVEKPVYVEKRIIEKDTIKILVRDSLLIVQRDTTYIALPREVKVYADSNYRAVVSGISPRLDSLSFRENTKYIYKTQKKSHWAFGITGGLGAVYSFESKSVACGPGISVGLTYHF